MSELIVNSGSGNSIANFSLNYVSNTTKVYFRVIFKFSITALLSVTFIADKLELKVLFLLQ